MQCQRAGIMSALENAANKPIFCRMIFFVCFVLFCFLFRCFFVVFFVTKRWQAYYYLSHIFVVCGKEAWRHVLLASRTTRFASLSTGIYTYFQCLWKSQRYNKHILADVKASSHCRKPDEGMPNDSISVGVTALFCQILEWQLDLYDREFYYFNYLYHSRCTKR